MTISEIRKTRALIKASAWFANAAEATRLKALGMSNVAIAKKMDTKESNVRRWIKTGAGLVCEL